MRNGGISLEKYIDQVATKTLGNQYYHGFFGYRAKGTVQSGVLQLEFNGKIVNTYRYCDRSLKLAKMHRWAKSVAKLKYATVVIINTPDE